MKETIKGNLFFGTKKVKMKILEKSPSYFYAFQKEKKGKGFQETQIEEQPNEKVVLPKICSKPIDPLHFIEEKEERYFLIKDRDGDIEALASGIRSAIVPIKNKWIRLKGCGNNYDRFPLLSIDGETTIRGCTFYNTASRELYYTMKIQEQLGDKMKLANKPIGFFVYPSVSSIDKCCCVMETIGDRRLSAHVLYGCEQYLATLKPPQKLPFKNRETLMLLLTKNQDDLFHQIHLFSNEIKKLATLYGYWGFLCGSFLKTLHEHHFNWGTYADKLGFHCNAHPNNFVILSDGQLAPLDFDMAFHYDKMLENKYSQEEMITLEYNCMLLSLAGEDCNGGVNDICWLSNDHLDGQLALRQYLAYSFMKGYDQPQLDVSPPKGCDDLLVTFLHYAKEVIA
mmetsp:Transcript_6777/g.9867  ORF Transcript_6777/g.9867 Transcript_6777/m.9867 type:complete len:397 (+) Transcript_6777:110-1300(+)